MASFILKCWTTNEHGDGDYDFAQVAIDPDTATKLLARMDQVAKIKEKEPSLYRLTYWDWTPEFFGEELAERPRLTKLLGRVESEELVRGEIALKEEDCAAMDFVLLHVAEDKVWWEASPKQGSERIDTTSISRVILARCARHRAGRAHRPGTGSR